MAHRAKVLLTAGAAAAVSLTLGGCASSGGDAGQADQHDAEATGQVTVYSPAAGELTDVFAAFNEDHPDIQINAVRLVGQELATRVRSEVTSGQHVADVVISATTTAFGPWGSGDTSDWFDPYLPESADALAEGAVHEEEGWFAPFSSGFGIAYNTDAVDEADLPSDWDALVDQEWAGRIVVPDPRQLSLSSLSIGGLYAQDVVDDAWLEAFADLDLRIVDGGPPVGQSLSTGESDLGFWGTGFVTNAIRDGAPLAWSEIPPVQSLNAAVLLADAPNPGASRLFLDWLLTENAQAALAESGYIPQVEGAAIPELLSEEALAASTIIPPYAESDPAIQHVMETFTELLG